MQPSTKGVIAGPQPKRMAYRHGACVGERWAWRRNPWGFLELCKALGGLGLAGDPNKQ